MRKLWVLGSVLWLSLTACAAFDPNVHADAVAKAAAMQREAIATDRFTLTAFSRITKPDQPLTVYIEGDGLAWISRYQPSLDPTPHEATGLELAALDPGPNVVYLARPCQFTAMASNPSCGVPYWTGRRFAPEVVRSLNQALDSIAARVPGQKMNLVGYSGGAALAVLVAAQRSDIASLRTVAGNLDDEYVNRLHGVSAMPESDNAIDVATRVAGIPQIHFSGGDDTVVPPDVAQRFIAAEAGHCAQARSIAGVGHARGWLEAWPRLVQSVPSCER